MSILENFAENALQSMREKHIYRKLRLMVSPESAHVQMANEDGLKENILLASNSYLDLANIFELKQAMANAVLEWGTGSGGGRV